MGLLIRALGKETHRLGSSSTRPVTTNHNICQNLSSHISRPTHHIHFKSTFLSSQLHKTPISLATIALRILRARISSTMPGRRGGGGSSRGDPPPQSREVAVSKAMSFVLRHGAEAEGLKLDKNGYANVAELVRGISYVLGRCIYNVLRISV